jgi:hypothetical protein
MRIRFVRFGVLAAVGLALLLALVAQASPRYRRAFLAKYPAAENTKLAECGTCHQATPPALNPYGAAFKAAHFTFDEIEKADSDKDGAANLAEIKALTLPGDPTDKPGAKKKGGAKADSTHGVKADSSGAQKAARDTSATDSSTSAPDTSKTKR